MRESLEKAIFPLRRLNGWLHEQVTRQKLKKEYRERYREKKQKNPRTVFLIMTAEHGNVGDLAITQAVIGLLRSMGIDYVEITDRKMRILEGYRMLQAMNGFPIVINGGGNLGTLWPSIERIQRKVIARNPRSPIFFMPNTIFYEDSPRGEVEFRKSIKLYNRHQKLYLYAREKNSYNVMQGTYKNVKLVPDMVLSMKACNQGVSRQGCLLCLRNDSEKTRTEEQETMIRAQARELFGQAVADTDMICGEIVTAQQRQEVMERKFSEFSGAQLVITDRLHGMIFCAITGTPCIVVDSKSPKVRGCYEWIRGVEYIRFADDPAQIVAEYAKIPNKDHEFDNTHLQPYFQELKEDMLDKLGWR